VRLPALAFASLALGAVWLLGCALILHYDCRALEREAADDACLVSILVMAVATSLSVLNVLFGHSAGLPKVPEFLLVFWPGVLCPRLFLFRTLSANQAPRRETLILGVGPLGRLTGDDLEKHGRHRVVGYLQFRDEARSSPLGARLLGTSDELEEVLRNTTVSEIYIAGDVVRQAADMEAAIRVCETLGMPFALPACSFQLERARPVASRAVADGYLHYLSVGLRPHHRAIKRSLDILFSSIALAILLPLFGVIGLVIKLTSSKPIFFGQLRVGLYGRPFQLLKFRSMVVNAEELKERLKNQNERTGPVFKMRNDPRLTRFGKFMRKYSLDELPQLINILRGDMSLVGPRPPVPAEVALYEPWQRRRLSVRPGLTCLWQCAPNRHQIPFDKWMDLDMKYIDQWSLTLDFALLCKTVPIVLTGNGD
jgi:exopolysaccharide biosynthesis polyprenyl glycosylphosphotransferase